MSNVLAQAVSGVVRTTPGYAEAALATASLSASRFCGDATNFTPAAPIFPELHSQSPQCQRKGASGWTTQWRTRCDFQKQPHLS